MKSTSSRRLFRVGRAKTGLGLFAARPIKKRQFIARYWGRRIATKIADDQDNKYMFELNSRWTIDGSNRRNVARYINHSCRPNAEADVVKGKIIIRAMRNIQPGDEITYNYGSNYFRTFIKPSGCKCAACRRKSVALRSPRLRGRKKRK